MVRPARDEIPAALAATWQASFEELPTSGRALLDLLAWLAPEPLPRFLFDRAAAPEGTETLFAHSAAPGRILAELCAAHPSRTDTGPLTDPEDALAALRALSLLQPDAKTLFASEGQVHRGLALMTRERQDEGTRTAALRAALALVNAAAVGEPDDVRHWSIWEPLQPHVGVLVDHAEAAGIGEPTARLLNSLGLFLKAKARYAEAEPLMRRALAIDEASFGPMHPMVAIDLNNLAGLLQDTDRLDEAEPLMRRALAIDEASFGPEHPTVAIDLNNLATILYGTHRLREAESLMLLALAIDETSYGPEHPNVAVRLNNLAALFQRTDRLTEAERLCRRALAIDEASFGPEHPTVAIDLNNLAGLLHDTDRPDEAEPLMRRALAIDEASFGSEHPTVAVDLDNLARVLRTTGRDQ